MFAPKGLGQRWTLLIGGDLACVIAALWASIALTGRPGFAVSDLYGPEELTATMAIFHLALMYFQDLYTIDHPRSDAWVAVAAMMATVKLALVLSLFVMAAPALAVGRVFPAAYLFLSVVFLIGWRFAANTFFFAHFNIGVMALGMSECAPALIAEIDRRRHLGYRFLGIATVGSDYLAMRTAGELSPDARPALISANSIADLSPRNGVNTLVVLDPITAPGCVRDLVQCRVRGTAVFDFESFFERIAGKLPIPFLRQSWLVYAPGFGSSHWRRLLKRASDIIVSLAIAVLTLPITLAATIAIKLDSDGSLFYSQERVGLNGEVFRVLKFRSMCADAERGTGAVWAQKNDPRVTRVGRIIRRTRIDELPQIINVLRGEMSVVGPRPERPEIVARLEAEIPYYQYRHFVRPGITGWAQICFPYGATIAEAREKLCYDLYYIKNWSLRLDVQIMLQTTKVVLFGRGAR